MMAAKTKRHLLQELIALAETTVRFHIEVDEDESLVARLVPAKEPCRICGYDRVEPDSPYCPFCGATRLM